MTQHDLDELRAALRSDLPSLAIPDVGRAMRDGRRQRRRRAAARVGAVAAVAVAVAVAAGSVLGGPGDSSRTTPADSQRQSMSPADRHAALVIWADCLRDADIPGVTVTGPGLDSDVIVYTDEQGKPLPRSYREVNGEWGSATEFCAALVPQLMPELRPQWGDLLAQGAATEARAAAEEAAYESCLRDRGLSQPSNIQEFEAALAAGCALTRFDPDAEKILQCPPAQRQSGIRSLLDDEGWMKTPKTIGERWLARQANRDEFAATKPNPTRQKGDTLLVTDRDGRTTAIVYLLTNTFKGFKLHAENVCQ
jgi:hypothetical protein